MVEVISEAEEEEEAADFTAWSRYGAVKEEKVFCAKGEEDEQPTSLFSYDGNEGKDQESWFLVTGASNHMTVKKNLFVTIDESYNDSISFADDKKIVYEGKGDILIQAKNGSHQFITDVYYVPKMKVNVLSLCQLLEKQFKIYLKNGALVMKDNKGNMIAKAGTFEFQQLEAIGLRENGS
eukprot:XP_015581921.1 uncharacterized protein LOC107262187 [Ricinus communis]